LHLGVILEAKMGCEERRRIRRKVEKIAGNLRRDFTFPKQLGVKSTRDNNVELTGGSLGREIRDRETVHTGQSSGNQGSRWRYKKKKRKGTSLTATILKFRRVGTGAPSPLRPSPEEGRSTARSSRKSSVA